MLFDVYTHLYLSVSITASRRLRYIEYNVSVDFVDVRTRTCSNVAFEYLNPWLVVDGLKRVCPGPIDCLAVSVTPLPQFDRCPPQASGRPPLSCRDRPTEAHSLVGAEITLAGRSLLGDSSMLVCTLGLHGTLPVTLGRRRRDGGVLSAAAALVFRRAQLLTLSHSDTSGFI